MPPPVTSMMAVAGAVGTAVVGHHYWNQSGASSMKTKDGLGSDRWDTPVFNYAKHTSNGVGSHVFPQRAFMSDEMEQKLASGDAAIAKALAIRKAKAEDGLKHDIFGRVHDTRPSASKESIVEH